MFAMGRGHVIPLLARLALAGAVTAVALGSSLAGPASAGSSAPCWKKLTLDWAADGTVDKTYPIPCYTEAIDHLGTTERLYSNAEDDIRRALQRAIATKNGQTTPASTTASPDVSSGGGGSSVPTPLIALGGVALVLVGLGGVGILRRRRRDGPGPS
jgi:hypothetical protein